MLKMGSLLNIVVKLRNNERSRLALRNVGSVIIGGGGAERRVEVKGERARRGRRPGCCGRSAAGVTAALTDIRGSGTPTQH